MNLIASVRLRTLDAALAALRSDQRHAREAGDIDLLSELEGQINALTERHAELFEAVFDPLAEWADQAGGTAGRLANQNVL